MNFKFSFLFFLISLFPFGTYAENSAPLSASITVPVYSAYVWRGIVVTDGTVIQPNATLSKNGFSLNTWSNYNLTDHYSDETKHEISEVDFTLSYGKAIGPVTISAAFAEYVYPHQTVLDSNENGRAASGTREIQISAGIPDLLLSPTLTIVRDIDEIKGFYASLALSQNLPLTRDLALILGLSAGAGDNDYNTGYFGVSNSGLNDGNVSVSLPVKISDSVTLTPLIQYTWLWDSDIKDQATVIYGDDSSLWGGVTLNVSL